MNKQHTILVIGVGYVGLATSVFNVKSNEVHAYDTSAYQIELLKSNDNFLNEYQYLKFKKKINQIRFTSSIKNLANNYDYIFLCISINFNANKNYFNRKLKSIIEPYVSKYRKSIFVIRSTLPIGSMEFLAISFPNISLIYHPEFLREGTAIYDIFYPKRIVIGSNKKYLSHKYVEFIKKNKKFNDDCFHLLSFKEAELVKLSSNTFLASRVAFFNEIDTYTMYENLNSLKVINAICADDRIGSFYNNPSFGFGGYCLPKDVKFFTSSLSNNFPLIKNINKSNFVRLKSIKQYISINYPNIKTIGFYRLQMKSNSSNFKNSPSTKLLSYLASESYEIFIYEPLISSRYFTDIEVVNDKTKFFNKSDLILANRNDESIPKNKLFTRDIFNYN